MTTSAREFIFKGLELILEPLAFFVEEHLKKELGEDWQTIAKESYKNLKVTNDKIDRDNIALFKIIDIFWKDVFFNFFKRTIIRSIVNELREVRNDHAHNEPFSDDEVERALSSMQILMESIDASDEATEIKKMRRIVLERCLTEEDVHAKADDESLTKSESLLLLSVETDKQVGNNSCTVLHFEGGSTKQMITAIFDKDGLITEKAKNLVDKRVKTKCWEPKDKPPGYYASKGYFNEIDEA